MNVSGEQFVPPVSGNEPRTAAPTGVGRICVDNGAACRTERQQGTAPETAYRRIILFSLVAGRTGSPPLHGATERERKGQAGNACPTF